ncbi:MAG: type I-E CRISPR-associated protein Cas7/Cse4/CasC [Proteobacteria bacterium]|nr:type I-E CRISPR-associated protein Cas7/Cse4/CasC [Pseudomonadota bacterium]MBU4472094.1 type I-E CRISPR-associated protein Cas7/Cse4/CasC [Pseudomonadota bacterium]MCG2752907.1 type I-E CRISPR-associated protein Cas7/Cse4/CasC [Desulfobacteraceae bacterium]
MKHLELHILQSVPVTCLNRDDLGSPKTAFFGGAQRARVSSQSWKRAIREYAHEICPYFNGQRSRLIIEPLKDELVKLGKNEEDAIEAAKKIAAVFGKLDSEAEKKTGVLRVKTVHYTSDAEIKALAEKYIELDDAQKAVKKVGMGVLKDAADISLFGRMVASDHSLTIEGAAMFNHPISTHKVDNELDFFAAVDDWQKEGDSGAGMTGTLEYNSSVYYRFAALNLDMLADKEHLACMTPDERKEVVTALLQATLEAVPGMTKNNSGRKNSMNGYTRPSYVLGIVRAKGHPIQFVNAFEEPIWTGAGKGIMKTSIEKLQEEEKTQNATWQLNKHELGRAVIPDKNIDEFIKEMVKHVE